MKRGKDKNGGPKGRGKSHTTQISIGALIAKRLEEAATRLPQSPAIPRPNGISPERIRAARKKKPS